MIGETFVNLSCSTYIFYQKNFFKLRGYKMVLLPWWVYKIIQFLGTDLIIIICINYPKNYSFNSCILKFIVHTYLFDFISEIFLKNLFSYSIKLKYKSIIHSVCLSNKKFFQKATFHNITMVSWFQWFYFHF